MSPTPLIVIWDPSLGYLNNCANHVMSCVDGTLQVIFLLIDAVESCKESDLTAKDNTEKEKGRIKF